MSEQGTGAKIASVIAILLLGIATLIGLEIYLLLIADVDNLGELIAILFVAIIFMIGWFIGTFLALIFFVFGKLWRASPIILIISLAEIMANLFLLIMPLMMSGMLQDIPNNMETIQLFAVLILPLILMLGMNIKGWLNR